MEEQKEVKPKRRLLVHKHTKFSTQMSVTFDDSSTQTIKPSIIFLKEKGNNQSEWVSLAKDLSQGKLINVINIF